MSIELTPGSSNEVKQKVNTNLYEAEAALFEEIALVNCMTPEERKHIDYEALQLRRETLSEQIMEHNVQILRISE